MRVPTPSDATLSFKTRMDASIEESWLEAARRGEPWALEHFYNAYRNSVYSLCWRMVGNADDAEDAMQAAFAQAFRAVSGFRGDCSAKTWVYRIAVNEALVLVRRRKTSASDADGTTFVSDSSVALVRNMAVESALASIRPAHRAILVLRYWEGLAYDEIGQVLSLSMSAVKMRIKRAKDEFRQFYGEEL